jgi:glucosamine kinase
MSTYFIGLDAGGTGTRALLATATGEVLGCGLAAGANAWSSGSAPADTIAEAVRAALGEHDPASVAGGVIAAAGAVSSVPEQAAAVVDAWRSLGLAAEPRIILDVVAAYAAGTTHPRGLVLAAGTGAIAAVVADGELVHRVGGRGWLLGDEGSAVWLGIEATRAALLELDGRGPATSLSGAVSAALGVKDGEPSQVATGITDVVYGGAPARLGQLAPLVIEQAEAGDEIATRIVATATDHLVATAVAAGGDAQPEITVLAGSLLTRAPLMATAVRAGLAERWPETEFAEAASGEAGATALAIGWHTGVPVPGSTLQELRAGCKK